MLLPIGSIVYLREGTSKIIILNRTPILPSENEGVEGIWYDDSACFYPRGLDPNKGIFFNEENIDEVINEGFKDEEEERFQKLFEDWMAVNKLNYKNIGN